MRLNLREIEEQKLPIFDAQFILLIFVEAVLSKSRVENTFHRNVTRVN